jgi:oxygen-independent coproporphyrinogen-3 oxidase
MADVSAGRVASLYIHVPFCAHKCEYCAFFSEAPSRDIIDRYVSALVRELELVADELRPQTVFFGGGTPSILNLRQWESILRAMDRLNLCGAGEWTVECNPATVSADKAKLLRDFGVNRASMGVQSFDEGLLERLGRIHSRQQVFRSFDVLRDAGFDNLNVDLMFAIPGQTMEIWADTLNEALALGSEHLSCYEVIYEQDTPLYAQLKAGEFDVNEDLACDMYEELVHRSGAAGFAQYEIANFARGANGSRRLPGPPLSDPAIPAFACRHNVNYWRGGDYHGLGPGATGYVRGVRTRDWSNTPLYCDQLEKGIRPFESREELPSLKRAGETAAFGLRMTAGWPFAEFQRVTGFDLRQEWADDMKSCVTRGWGELQTDRFRLTHAGLRFADAAAEMFVR